MTPGARIQAAIELLDAIAVGRGAADDIVGNYFRRHRFAGVKDRGAGEMRCRREDLPILEAVDQFPSLPLAC